MKCPFCGEPLESGRHPLTESGVRDVTLCQFQHLVNRNEELQSKLDALTTELALLRSKEAEYGWRSKGLMADKIAQQAEIIETHCMAPMIDGQCSAEKAALSRLPSVELELRSARYVLGAFCKASGGEAYISRATLAALSPSAEIERRDEPDGGIYYRLVERHDGK
jgi:hypothetical protein